MEKKITLTEAKKSASKSGITYKNKKFHDRQGNEMVPEYFNGNIHFKRK